jgi:hypothetical protein
LRTRGSAQERGQSGSTCQADTVTPDRVKISANDAEDVSGVDAKTALEALATIGAIPRRGEEIRYITSPQEGEIGVEMLRVLAREEEELQGSA